MNVDILSTWSLIRFSGFLAFYLLTLSIAAGLLSRITFFQSYKPLIINVHQTSGWIGFLGTIFHMVILWKDDYISYQITEIFIPFTAHYSPVFSAFGTIAFFLFFVTMFTSDFFIKSLGKQVWRKIHLLVIPAWFLMLLHSILIGTDTEQPWALSVYGGSVALVILLLCLRLAEGVVKPTKKTVNK